MHGGNQPGVVSDLAQARVGHHERFPFGQEIGAVGQKRECCPEAVQNLSAFWDSQAESVDIQRTGGDDPKLVEVLGTIPSGVPAVSSLAMAA